MRALAGLLLGLSLLALGVGERALDVVRAGGRLAGGEPPMCAFRAQTGLPCLGCGGTRALARMARGDWRAAVDANPLGAYLGLALWVLAAAGSGSLVSGRSGPLKLAIAGTASLLPAAFVWNAIRWWLWLPPGSGLLR